MTLQSAPRPPANRAEVVEVMARALCRTSCQSASAAVCQYVPCHCDRNSRSILAALEAAGVRLVPVEPLERQLVGGMIRPDYYQALAASPYAPEGD